MSVYVDALFRMASREPRARFAGARTRHKWCHMFADTDAELFEMAEKIGLEKRWFQEDSRFPHFDLTPNKRVKAVELGAREKSTKEILLQITLKRRAQMQSELPKRETKDQAQPTTTGVPSGGSPVTR